MLFRERLHLQTGGSVLLRLMLVLTAIFFTVVISLMQPDVALAKDTDCLKKRGDVQIKACTRIIKSKRYLGKRVNNKQLSAFRLIRGIAYKNKGQFDKAFADYDKAIQLNPKSAAAYNNRGIVYYIKDQFDKAIADFDKAIKLNPKLADAYFNRGNAYRYKDQHDRAIADYRKVLEIDPPHSLARQNLKGLGAKP